MLTGLKFVQGAIKKNHLSPELEYFQIRDGRVVGFNGFMALSAPLESDLEVKPKASMFHKALAACGEKVSINLTPAGRLHISSEGFSAYVPCTEREVYEAVPEGDFYDAPPELAAAFTQLAPFISDDASRPWSRGLAVGNGVYTATNNVVIVQRWDGNELPYFNCPDFAVNEIARIKDNPVSIQINPGVSVTFHYSDGRWLKTQLLASDWPVDKMNAILGRELGELVELPTGFVEGLQVLEGFAESQLSSVFFRDGEIATGVPGAEEGARVAVEGVPAGPIFSIKALKLVSSVADRIEFSAYPAPCRFFGEKLRGAVLGKMA